jgi:predicted RNA-binding protein YlqC (UPF0109 family)
MKIWEKHSKKEILKSLEVEMAKAQAELKCANRDIEKVHSRVGFVLSAIHHLQTKIDTEE